MQIFESTLHPDTRQYTDFGLLAKFAGPNNNTIILITSFHEGGVIHGAKAISKSDFTQKMQEMSGVKLNKSFNFRSVLQVEGFRQTDLNAKIKYFEILKP